MNILDLYKTLLPLVGLQAVDDKILTFRDKQVKVNKKKPLVMPVKHNLTAESIKVNQVFHPCAEDITLGASLTVNTLLNSANIYYNYRLSEVLVALMVVASSTTDQKKLSMKQKSLLRGMADTNSRDLKQVADLVGVVMASSKHKFINLKLTGKRELNGVKYLRVCKVTFPIYNQIDDAICADKPTLAGLKFTKRALLTLKKSLEILLPGIDKKDHYSYGGDINGAPFVEALSGSLLKLAGDLNKFIPSFSDLKYPIDVSFGKSNYFKDRSKLSAAIAMIPPIAGNKGSRRKSDVKPIDQTQTAKNLIDQELEVAGNVVATDDPPWNEPAAKATPKKPASGVQDLDNTPAPKEDDGNYSAVPDFVGNQPQQLGLQPIMPQPLGGPQPLGNTPPTQQPAAQTDSQYSPMPAMLTNQANTFMGQQLGQQGGIFGQQQMQPPGFGMFGTGVRNF